MRETTKHPERREGTMEEALANGRALLRQDASMALRQAQAILQRDPGELRALRLAAAAHRARGEKALAERAEQVAIEKSNTIPLLAAAEKAMRAGEYGEASRLAAEQLRSEPDDLAALTFSAESAIALGLPDKAIPLLETVLGRVSGFVHARMLLANALMLTDRLKAARALLEPMRRQLGQDPSLLNLLARINSDLGDLDAANEIGGELTRLEPNSAETWTNYGDTLRFSGQRAKAIWAYRKAIGVESHHGRAWWSLTDLDPAGIGNSDLAAIEDALAARENEPEHAGNLHFTLGIVRDARGEAEAAFRHFAAGNALRREAQPYDPDEITTQVNRYLALLTRDCIPQVPADSVDSAPIFILGMPRAGSTLVERMLGRHSCVEALGELAIVPHMVQRMKLDCGDNGLERHVAELDEAKLKYLGEWYLARAGERMKSSAPLFIDKLHMNWRHLGLILRMLPQARIVDVRRDAMDCCWSNFKTLFARGHPAASDLEDLGRFYLDYMCFTDTLREYAPERIMLLQYEKLVENPEEEARKLCGFIGVSFEATILDFHLSKEPVATASSEQVRQPLNRRGIGAWKPYAQWLGPLRDALGPLDADV